jgi:hypothetical protein
MLKIFKLFFNGLDQQTRRGKGHVYGSDPALLQLNLLAGVNRYCLTVMNDLLHSGRRLLDCLRKRLQYSLIFMSDTQHINRPTQNHQHASTVVMSFGEIMRVIARPAVVDGPAQKQASPVISVDAKRDTTTENKSNPK